MRKQTIWMMIKFLSYKINSSKEGQKSVMSAIINVSHLDMCTSYGETPCFAGHYISIAQEHKMRNATDNKSIRYFAYKKYIHDTYGILGKGQRIKLPYCVETSLKLSFPNEDETPFVGFQDSSAEY